MDLDRLKTRRKEPDRPHGASPDIVKKHQVIAGKFRSKVEWVKCDKCSVSYSKDAKHNCK